MAKWPDRDFKCKRLLMPVDVTSVTDSGRAALDNFLRIGGGLQEILICPACQGQFSLRDFLRQRACPLCDVSLGFSIPYRLGLATFSVAVFLYCSYKAVVSSGMLSSIVGLMLAAPLALIARLLYISNVPPLLRRWA
jgi:hypothetical protein